MYPKTFTDPPIPIITHVEGCMVADRPYSLTVCAPIMDKEDPESKNNFARLPFRNPGNSGFPPPYIPAFAVKHLNPSPVIISFVRVSTIAGPLTLGRFGLAMCCPCPLQKKLGMHS